MYSKEEKLGLLSDMIEFAKADLVVKDEELRFIFTVANRLNVTEEDVQRLLKGEVTKKVLRTETHRIAQFHRLVLLMNVDDEISPLEIDKIKEMGVQMGLRPEAIDNVLMKMNEYPDKMIPSEDLAPIFKKFYN